MGQQELTNVLRRQPVEPFRVSLTNGQTFDIHHPDMALVTRSSVHIGIPAGPPGKERASDVVIVSLIHVVKIEFLAAATPSSN